MFQLKIHKDAQKVLKKTPLRIKKKAFVCLSYFMHKGIDNIPYPIKKLQGDFRKFEYFEVKIDKDYRIIYRFDRFNETFYIRYAGTHNALGTG